MVFWNIWFTIIWAYSLGACNFTSWELTEVQKVAYKIYTEIKWFEIQSDFLSSLGFFLCGKKE